MLIMTTQHSPEVLAELQKKLDAVKKLHEHVSPEKAEIAKNFMENYRDYNDALWDVSWFAEQNGLTVVLPSGVTLSKDNDYYPRADIDTGWIPSSWEC
jgi:hypothetical protein